MKYSETITWTPIEDGLPDDNETVLVQLDDADEPIWLGFHEDGQWYEVGAAPIEGVAAWAAMPEGIQG